MSHLDLLIEGDQSIPLRNGPDTFSSLTVEHLFCPPTHCKLQVGRDSHTAISQILEGISWGAADTEK